MHIIIRRFPRAALASLVLFLCSLPLGLLSGCYPSSPGELGHKLVVHGVVTDAGTGLPIAGIQVTLLSLDNFAPETTGAQGYFQFSDVLQEQNLLVQFQGTGYRTVTLTVNPTLIADGGVGDGGIATFPGFGANVDGFDASIALVQSLGINVAGTVYSGAAAAAGAQVALTDANGTPVYQMKAGTDGTFAFPSVNVGDYQLIVLPWDRDADGLSDTQFYSQDLPVTPLSGDDFGHLAINLVDVQKALVASSFVNLSQPYPITGAQLLEGVSGVLQATGGTLFLAFGAEVDPTLTSFELVQFEADGTRFSPDIGLTVAWSHGAIAQLTPASALKASDASSLGYQLRIRSLRFTDGTVAIPASPSAYGMINFAVQSLPQALANPQPAVYLASQVNSTQVATKAIFDANEVWLVDLNGDFVSAGLGPTWTATNPIQLQWPSVSGAVAYHLFMRNTTSAGGNAAGSLDWVEQTSVVIEASDPNQTQTVVATNVSPWSLALGSAAGPWSFGNHIQFAVTSQDALGFIAPIDTTKLLDTADTFGGLISGVAFDPDVSGAPFASTTELGDTFIKTLQINFTEPMLTSSALTLAPLGARVSVKKQLAAAWGNSGGQPTLALNSAAQGYLNLLLGETGTCTEVTVPRAAGDTLIAVRDASYFGAGATSKLVFLSGAGAFIAESDGVVTVDTTANLLTLTTALAMGVSVPQGSLACSLGGATVANVPTANGTTLTVSSASQFAAGDTVLYYEPQSASSALGDLLTVTGVDTVNKTVSINTAPSLGHTGASLLFGVPSGGEIALRDSTTIALAADVPGGSGAVFTVTAPVPGLAVGDTVLVDADGDLNTTPDQIQVKVTQLGFAPAGIPPVYTFTADLPATLTLLHGRAKVIALGDAFTLTGANDTSGNTKLDSHRDQFTPDGVLF